MVKIIFLFILFSTSFTAFSSTKKECRDKINEARSFNNSFNQEINQVYLKCSNIESEKCKEKRDTYQKTIDDFKKKMDEVVQSCSP